MDEKEPEFPTGRTWLVNNMRILPSAVGVLTEDGAYGNETVLGLLIEGVPCGHHTEYPPRMDMVGIVWPEEGIAETIVRFTAYAHYVFRHFGREEIRDQFWKQVHAHHVPMDALVWLMEGQPPVPAAPDGPLDSEAHKAAEMAQETPATPAEGDRAEEPAPEAQEGTQGPCLCGALAFVSQEPVRHFPGCIHWRTDTPVTPYQPEEK